MTLIAAAGLTTGIAATAAAAPMAAGAAMPPSWNLGNTLDAIPDETSWGDSGPGDAHVPLLERRHRDLPRDQVGQFGDRHDVLA